MPSTDPGAPEARGIWAWIARLVAVGPTTQALPFGLYAWGVTVAPSAWGRGGGLLAEIAALAGLAAIIAAPWLERARPVLAARMALWGLVVTSAIVWLVAPSAVTPPRLDVAHGVTGMLGWGLFAYGMAGPALTRPPPGDDEPGEPLVPRQRLARGDRLYVGAGLLLAVMLQLVGWEASTPERALVVRSSTLAAGLGLVGASVELGLARHARRVRQPTRRRHRVALPWLAAVALVSLLGVALWILR